RLQIEDQLERGRLLNGEISRLGAPQDLVQVDRSTPLHLGCIYSIGHESTWLNKYPEIIDCGNPMRGRQIDDGLSMREHKGWRHHHHTLVVILLHAEESGSQVPHAAHDEWMNIYAEAPSRCDGDLLTVPSGCLGECRGRDILSKKRDLGKIRYKRFEKLETLWDEIIVQELGPRDIAPRPWEAVDEFCGDKILVGATDHDGDGFRFPLKDLCQARARDEPYIDLETYEVSGACARLIGLIRRTIA